LITKPCDEATICAIACRVAEQNQISRDVGTKPGERRAALNTTRLRRFLKEKILCILSLDRLIDVRFAIAKS